MVGVSACILDVYSWHNCLSPTQNSWQCSVCRRKAAPRLPPSAQDSTDSLLDVPVLDALQRRHSEARLGSGGGSSGLAPPRSPELRRHSDVSPASLKELEKVMFVIGPIYKFNDSFRSSLVSHIALMSHHICIYIFSLYCLSLVATLHVTLLIIFVTTLPAAAVKGRRQHDAIGRIPPTQHRCASPPEISAHATTTLL